MNNDEKNDLYLKFLNYIYDCFQQSGEIRSLTPIAEKYGVNKNYAGIALQKMGIIEKIQGRGIYSWKASQHPTKHLAKLTRQMVSKLSYEATKKSKSNTSKTQRKLKSLEDVKKAAAAEARINLIKASKAASVLGVNLLEMEENKIEKFVAEFAG